MYDFFDEIVLSCDLGVKKPNEAILLFPSAILDVPPDGSLLIDDTKENTDSAERLGMHAFLYNRNFEELKEYMSKRGVRI